MTECSTTTSLISYRWQEYWTNSRQQNVRFPPVNCTASGLLPLRDCVFLEGVDYLHSFLSNSILEVASCK
ncbi:hypothetical protein AV530_015890 [Patagioenas fasciata monilis]|uniref:Uncharacterized protein n=1 Tax=Patagioenas fasciata monilis TaxID=372326 RepID=A0A1V4KJA3_PATFA|nr:hypothetical protein AV530_015890 [Patagioenas fasciata monilis]